MVRIATFKPTADWKWDGTSEIPYQDVNDDLKDKLDTTVFSKVGYYMELKRKNTALTDYHGNVRYVWADMKAFEDGKFATLGVPTIKHQQVVENLHVDSNDTGIRKILPTDNMQTGAIEFWPNSYSSAQGSSASGYPANLCGYDWNDSTSSGMAYGSMQIHRVFKNGDSWNQAEVLMAFNRWTGNNANEIGIGSFASKFLDNAGNGYSVDYTQTSALEAMNAGAYADMTIEIWGKVKNTCTWIGNGDNVSWSNPANWENGVPTEGDDVVVPADANITLDSDVVVAKLTIQDASAVIGGKGSITVTDRAASTLKGTATIVFDGSLPEEAVRTQLQSADWKGEAILKGISTSGDFHPEYYGNANSIVAFCGITPACLPEAGTFNGEIKLINNGTIDAWTMGNGYSRNTTGYVIAKLSGDGSFTDTNAGVTQQITINDGSAFTGNLTIVGKRWVFGTTAVTDEASKKRITVQDGQKIKFAGQTWSATNGVLFGPTVKIVGSIGEYITMPEPSSIPGVITDAGNASDDLALKYEDGKLKIVAAGAQTESGKSYETIEEAINSEETPTIKIAEDAAPLAIENIAANKTFKLADDTKTHFDWTETSVKYLALTAAGLTVKEGTPANQTFTGEGATKKLVALGLDASDANDTPYIKAAASSASDSITFNFFHGTAGAEIAPTGIGGKTVKYAVLTANSSTADADWTKAGEPSTSNEVTVDLPQPENDGESAVRYFKPKFIFE